MQDEYAATYAKYKITPPLPTFREFCFPTNYVVQKPQAFLGDFVKHEEPRATLIVHKIGAGKTCAAIQIMARFRAGRPLIIMPASLIPGFYAELRTPCSPHPYLTVARRKALAAGGMSARVARREMKEEIDKDYEILSYSAFLNRTGPTPSIIVVDEVQEVLGGGSIYRGLLQFIQTRQMPIVLMSATPITDNVSEELPRLAALMRIDATTPEEFAAALQSRKAAVSYYRGAPPYTFPKVERRHVNCHFSNFQREAYLSAVNRENTPDSFYSQTRQRANAVVPYGDISALTPYQLSTGLAKYSAKFAEWLRRVSKGGLHFTFCEYTGVGGIALITRILKQAGWKNYFSHGAGKNRYVKWTGDQTARQKDKIRELFNSPENDGAKIIKLIIGSAAMKTGVSLMRVGSVHILEMHWNKSYIEQVEGRCVRYCSAKTLPREKRKVKIYYYIGWAAPVCAAPTPADSIDLYILQRAEEKQVAIDAFIDVVKKNAVDRWLFQ
jgi:hypothetical protein